MSSETVYVTLPPQLPDSKFAKFSASFMNTLAPVHCTAYTHTHTHSFWSGLLTIINPGENTLTPELNPSTVLIAAYHKHDLMLWCVHRCHRWEIIRSRAEFCLQVWVLAPATAVTPSLLVIYLPDSHLRVVLICEKLKWAFLPECACKHFPDMLRHSAAQSQICPRGILHIPRIEELWLSKPVQNWHPFLLQREHSGHVCGPQIYGLNNLWRLQNSECISLQAIQTSRQFIGHK